LPHVLLVEDNPADIGLVREALREHQVGCDLTVIKDGAAAIKFIEDVEEGIHHCPDLIIVDLNLPKRPGREVLQHVRAGKSRKEIPIVVLTSSDNQKDKDDVAEYNPSIYIRKPSKLDEFMKLGVIFKNFLYPVS